MIIKEKLGNLTTFPIEGRSVDPLPLEWYETGKRILHKKTAGGKEVILKFLGEAPGLQQDDVLFAGREQVIAVEILPCEAIILQPSTSYETAYVCYEIGNKHLPLFFDNGTLLMPYDAPVYRLLQASGMKPQVARRQLLYPLRTSVSPHGHAGDNRPSLFSRILKRTTDAE